jgi:DNA-binding GntR family transcriptional regulator
MVNAFLNFYFSRHAPPPPAVGHTPLQRPPSLKDAAYRQIKDLLLAGKLQPDQLYSAQFFAEMLGVSRTPVREALLQLAAEGLLNCLDVRGFKIKEFTAKEIRDVTETRALIETHVIAEVAEHLPADDLRRLEQGLRSMASCARKRDDQGFIVADKDFHMVLLRRCDNQHLLAIMENIRNHISIFGLKALRHPARYEEVLREHGAILDALRQHDRKKAVQAMAHHLATTQEYLLGNKSVEARS